MGRRALQGPASVRVQLKERPSYTTVPERCSTEVRLNWRAERDGYSPDEQVPHSKKSHRSHGSWAVTRLKIDII